ncbi:ferredoxin [Methanolinea mesophila]|jgi:ferredoxin|uniref:indolepyruvate ferredoxin oxidoreductase subunit alpha n=1 Tax=Methanolinea mesophila TaxID=547055 RepID=UPI001AE7A87B|nr:4Fe-4S binding protein [Methanolinea mesophila]MBP1927835.1 ferredoxin [Methanolinea mesophila]
MTAKVNEEKCTGCETCVDECPAAAITIEKEKAKIDKDLCVDCGNCVDVCPSEAITLE